MRRAWMLVIFMVPLLAGCGASAEADCAANIAVVNGAQVPAEQFNVLLRYSLGFFEQGNVDSRYYGTSICGSARLAAECSAIKRELQQRMIDQQIVNTYADAHNLQPTNAEWANALAQEGLLVKKAGSPTAFRAYLTRLGTDEAQFRYLEGQEIETANVDAAIGPSHFKAWLAGQETPRAVARCPLP